MAIRCGTHHTYPDLTGKRVAEGGRRLLAGAALGSRQQPLVTVITVCKNAGKTLPQTIDSVRRQTYPYIEHLILDAASTDNTLDVIRQHAETLEYFVSEPDTGLYNAINKGLTLAKGEYILVLNADDWYEPDCVERLLEAMEYSGASFVSALARLVDENGMALRIQETMPVNDSVRFGMSLRHETMLIPASIYNSMGGYDEKFKIIADFKFSIRLFNNHYTNYEIPLPLLNFRTTGVSNINITGLLREHEMLVAEQFPFLTPEQLSLVANPREITASKIATVINANPKRPLLVSSLSQYAKRRNMDISPLCSKAVLHGQRPCVSVIVPVYKTERVLSACLDSILQQSLQEIEVICVNDCSPDNVQAVIDRYSQQDPRVRSIVNPTNNGVSAARNTGLQAARGEYVMFVDSDDALAPGALQALYTAATAHDSDIVKGCYLFVAADGYKVLKGNVAPYYPMVNTTALEFAPLLEMNEGHQTALFRYGFIMNHSYPQDIRIGEDSFFLIKAFIHARSVTLIEDIVYYYNQNPSSAMCSVTATSYFNALTWRKRIWCICRDFGHLDIGNHYLLAYWNDTTFQDMSKHLNRMQAQEFLETMHDFYRTQRIDPAQSKGSPLLKKLFTAVAQYRLEEALLLVGYPSDTATAPSNAQPEATQPRASQPAPSPAPASQTAPLKVLTFCTHDSGGAGIGSRRRVLALRNAGVDAVLKSLLVHGDFPFSSGLLPPERRQKAWQDVHNNAIKPLRQLPGYCASELFSSPYSCLDYRTKRHLFADYAILHLHWVVGILDYARLGETLYKKPVVWTLADMNAFTGGCHYAEGCTRYEQECTQCPLLGGSDLAHQNWQLKKAAYAQLQNLHIICPSTWMAECVSRSSLLGDRPVTVIHNGFPVNHFPAMNPVVARARLGLPFDKKLVLFGAHSLNNKRKGGDLLAAAVNTLATNMDLSSVEAIVYGQNSLDLPIKVNALGVLSSDKQLALAYAAANVFAFPSREDNAPLTVGESLFCGTPVVSFPVGYVPEIVQHKVTGYIANYLDTEDFARGLQWALQSATKDIAMASRCRQRALQVHDPATAAARHLAIYRGMLG